MITPTAITLAIPLIFPGGSQSISNSGPFEVRSYLCDSAQYAIDFAAAVADNQDEEYAENSVGKLAKRQVCGLYAGVAVIQEEKTIINDGFIYRITKLRFREDNRIAWSATRIFAAEEAPSSTHL